MKNLKYLTATHLSSVFAKADAKNNLSVVGPDGSYQDAPGVTSSDHRAAHLALVDSLNALPDEAVMELEALMWLGRRDIEGADLPFLIDYSKKKFEKATRQYIAEKRPLRQYVEAGLADSGASLAS